MGSILCPELLLIVEKCIFAYFLKTISIDCQHITVTFLLILNILWMYLLTMAPNGCSGIYIRRYLLYIHKLPYKSIIEIMVICSCALIYFITTCVRKSLPIHLKISSFVILSSPHLLSFCLLIYTTSQMLFLYTFCFPLAHVYFL